MDIKGLTSASDPAILYKTLIKSQRYFNKEAARKDDALAKQSHTVKTQAQEIINLKLENEKLRVQLNKQLSHRFSRHSEKVDPKQLQLELGGLSSEAVEAIEEAEESITVASHSRKKTGRRPLPAHLPREERLYDLAEEEKVCDCGHALHKLGEDISEQLEIIPARMKVIRHVRYKYGCRGCECGVKSARLPAQAIPKSLAAPGLLSHVLVSKYVDHLPLYRQEAMLKRLGVDIARATLCYWMMKCGELLSPLYESLKELIQSSSYIQADETSLQVLNGLSMN